MHFLRKNWFLLSFFCLLTLLSSVYLWNVFQYNTYWGYDGGAHVDYIFTIAEENRLPSMEENYLAWHEPLFYLSGGLLVKILYSLDLGRPCILKILQVVGAGWGILLVAGSGYLAYLATRKRFLSLVVIILVGLLPTISEASRFITNEIVFHAFFVWWLVLFFFWQMDDQEKWTWPRWIILGLALAVLGWIKITALVLLFGLVLWLLFVSVKNKSWRPIFVVLVMSFLFFLCTSPWLFYKHKVFGNAATINVYEQDNRGSETMTLGFYAKWSNGIMRHPFWPSGTESFSSMFYADSLGDYYNIFQNYESEKEQIYLTTINGRLISSGVLTRTLLLYWWTVGLVVLLLIGLALYIYRLFKSKFDDRLLFLFILLLGFVLSLAYNTYHYPFLERGTMKTIFILSFFPLFFITSLSSWSDRWWENKKTAHLIGLVYLVVWILLTLSVIILPS